MPHAWCEDPDRRQAAHIPEAVTFQSKPELALQMLRRAWDEDLPLAWVAADTVYGNSPVFRNGIHAENRYYVAGISQKKVLLGTHSGQIRSALNHITDLPETDWTHYSTRAGEKGLIWYDWMRLRVTVDNDEIGEQWLLVRRNLHTPEDYDFFLSNAPQTCSLEVLVMVASARHHIEEALEECKGQAGLADYEVRFWHSWYRHITLSMLAYTLLTLLRFEQEPEKKNALRQLAHLQPC